MSEQEILIHNKFLENFSTYQSFGVEITYTNKSITFNYNEKNKKYIDALLKQFYDENNSIIIFRCKGKNVSFTSTKLDYNELFYKVKNIMDSVKFSYAVENGLKDNTELSSIVDLFEKACKEHSDLVIGVNSREDDKYYKLVSDNYSMQETFKKNGLSVKENAAYFRKSKSASIENIFNSIKNNPLVYYYQPNDVKKSGYVGAINVAFYLIIDFVAIALGIYLLMQ